MRIVKVIQMRKQRETFFSHRFFFCKDIENSFGFFAGNCWKDRWHICWQHEFCPKRRDIEDSTQVIEGFIHFLGMIALRDHFCIHTLEIASGVW